MNTIRLLLPIMHYTPKHLTHMSKLKMNTLLLQPLLPWILTLVTLETHKRQLKWVESTKASPTWLMKSINKCFSLQRRRKVDKFISQMISKLWMTLTESLATLRTSRRIWPLSDQMRVKKRSKKDLWLGLSDPRGLNGVRMGLKARVKSILQTQV